MNEHFYMEIYLADTPHRRNAQHFGGGSEQLRIVIDWKKGSGDEIRTFFAKWGKFIAWLRGAISSDRIVAKNTKKDAIKKIEKN